ncbi:hypothetical protein SAMN05421753_112179 [Planctomicrobium piriforme]|uniref:Uncharacterized protein n=1 Tax=Planctomicrobium piriforme TaxID=1576369 RepID=A0A1I3L8Z3_9PLAN|nr:hypothetical protein SAMN05421753_112179 [Planctomicrobium piriforme]
MTAGRKITTKKTKDTKNTLSFRSSRFETPIVTLRSQAGAWERAM